MKKLLLLLVLLPTLSFAGRSRLVFDPEEKVGIEMTHEEHAGSIMYKHKNLQWINQGRVETTRVGITMQVPVLDSFVVSGRVGKVWHHEFSPETYDMSSREYRGDGMYYGVNVTWQLGR